MALGLRRPPAGGEPGRTFSERLRRAGRSLATPAGREPSRVDHDSVGDHRERSSSMTDDASLGTMLCVWAHPDDETYLAAGLMAQAVSEGRRVVCVTATRGEEGSWDEDRWPSSEMGKVREQELMASLEVLGVTEHLWLDYYDGTCAGVEHSEG